MALQVKADVNDIPSILKLFGLGGMPAAAEDTGGAPPVDASLGGAAQPTAAPDTSSALPDAGPPAPPDTGASPLASTHDETKPPTKLLRLQQALGTDQPVPVPSPTLNLGPGEVMPPADLAGSMAAGTAQIDPTFRERHPNIFKTLGAISNFVESAGPGIGAPTFGQGFAAAAAEGPRKAKEELDQAQGKANLAHTQAATEQMKSQVTLPNGLTVPFALAQKLYPAELAEMGKDKRNQANIDSREGMASDKNALALRKQGLKLDPSTGKQVPLSRDEMSETEQAHLDLQQSQQDAAAARAEMIRNKDNPDSPSYKAAMGRLKVAQGNMAINAQKLGLAKDTFNANYLGTGPDGQALPGVPLTDNGTPVGVRTANITKPTGTTRSKADQAGVVIDQGNALLKQIDANPELYGAVAGRWNEFNAGHFGNASQEVRDAYTSLRSFAALQPALHGARGLGMMKEFENAVGNMGNDPDGLKGSVQSLLRTARDFKKAGTMNTAPGGSHPAATHVYDPATGVIAPIQK